MSDIRQRLADALETGLRSGGTWWAGSREIPAQAEHMADALLSLPGIAITEVPEGMYVALKWDRDALLEDEK